MTKKIYAIIMKKNGQSQKPRGVFQKPRGVFPPHFQMGGKNPQGFFKKINIKISSRNKFV